MSRAAGIALLGTNLASKPTECTIDTSDICTLTVAKCEVPSQEAFVYDSKLFEQVFLYLRFWLDLRGQR